MRLLIQFMAAFVAVASIASAAEHRGFHEIKLTAEAAPDTPGEFLGLKVTFTRPGGEETTVDGFHVGGRDFAARAYCDTVGTWRWRTEAAVPGLDGKAGSFEVMESDLPGKLRIHRHDERQFQYDNGDWFLHIGDTGYRYVTASEPKWQAYIDQAAQMGATKIRTWFCEGRSDVQALFTEDRKGLALEYWAEMDKRLQYALEKHPRVQFKLIIFGEDTEELKRYAAGDAMAFAAARYAQARFSALPNVHWCISNDREIIQAGEQTGRQILASTIDQIGRDMAAREPWGTLLTNHQSRFKGYDFARAPWSDIVTLEDLDQVDGAIIREYRWKGRGPVINDEDRYELYRQPEHPRYFFRRLMWSSLCAGGMATYGGLKTYEPYDGELAGVQGYYDNADVLEGADDFQHIHKFFREAGITTAGLRRAPDAFELWPSEALCSSNGFTWLVYLANPDHDAPGKAGAATKVPRATMKILNTRYHLRWFNPSSGEWHDGGTVTGPRLELEAPGGGDWVVLLRLDAGQF